MGFIVVGYILSRFTDTSNALSLQALNTLSISTINQVNLQ